jgi:hypothetical protein
MRPPSLRLGLARSFSAALLTTRRRGGESADSVGSVELNHDLVERASLAALECFDRSRILGSLRIRIRLVVDRRRFQRSHHGVLCAFEQHREGIDRLLRELVDEAVQVSFGHSVTLARAQAAVGGHHGGVISGPVARRSSGG